MNNIKLEIWIYTWITWFVLFVLSFLFSISLEKIDFEFHTDSPSGDPSLITWKVLADHYECKKLKKKTEQ